MRAPSVDTPSAGVALAASVMGTPQLTALSIAIGAGLALLLLSAAVTLVRAGQARRRMQGKIRELDIRTEQLRLLNRFTYVLSQEGSRRGVVSAALDFFVREMGAGRVVYWQPDSDGEPEVSWLCVPREDSASQPLSEAHRIILARTAARGTTPLIVNGDRDDRRPHPLSVAGAPAGNFALYVPLPGSPREGVLEVYAGEQHWGQDRWEVIGSLALQLASALRRSRRYEEVREQADRDFVTGLFNHRFMQIFLQRLTGAREARDQGFAVLLMDVNNFKMFNDTYGHSVGDRVLQAIADQLKLMTDRVGVVGRFGGDEFIVVLPGHSPEEASAFAQAFQDWLTNYTFTTPSGHAVPIKVAWGQGSFPEDGRRRQEVLAAADARLYHRKRHGKRADGHGREEGSRGLGTFGLLDSLVSSIDGRDNYTRAHGEITAEYAVSLAQELGLSPSAQRTLRMAALLHDVGKICIPDDILRKPGPLTAEEFAVIKHHATIAADLIVDLPNADEVRTIVRHHHERFDGTGYPDGLDGEQIPFLARVLALADAFSAMTLDRPYRSAMPVRQAHDELQRVAGTQLDPGLVKAFERVIATQEEESLRLSPQA